MLKINNKIYKIWIFSVACCYNSWPIKSPIKTQFAFHSSHQMTVIIHSLSFPSFVEMHNINSKATAFYHVTWTEFSYSALVILRYDLGCKNEEINLLYRKWPISSECPTKNMKPVSLGEKLSHTAMQILCKLSRRLSLPIYHYSDTGGYKWNRRISFLTKTLVRQSRG